MPNLFCVRAEYGKYTDCFIKGEYVAIGWLPKDNLSKIVAKDEIRDLYTREYPQDTSKYVIGQQVGQIARFLLEMKPGDYVITPDSNTELIHYGILEDKGYFKESNDNCPYSHRRKVSWNRETVQRSRFSVPFQNSIRSSLTVFAIESRNDFFGVIGKKEFVEKSETALHRSANEVILDRVLQLDAREFELLVKELLTTVGFESKHTGKTGDGGVDAQGELDLYGMARINLIVQAKRYKRGVKIRANAVKALRQNIHQGAQGAFITTAEFSKEALETAIEPGFPRIGTISGDQLVDILVEKWDDLPPELRERLGLRRSLVVD